MNIEIRDNVPKPVVASKAGRKSNYEFSKLTLGKSFVLNFVQVLGESASDVKAQKNFRRNFSNSVKNYNKKHVDAQTILSVADVTDPSLGGPGVGVWCEAKPEATV